MSESKVGAGENPVASSSSIQDDYGHSAWPSAQVYIIYETLTPYTHTDWK